MIDKLVVNSCSKINLGLNIVSKRDDGFHNLETIFFPLKLSDKIDFSKSDKFSFKSDNKTLNSDDNNLIIKAKIALEEYLGNPLNVNISLNKKIPIGAGLGGGSSNAASTLLALIKLFNLKLEKGVLNKIALSLGSDVPYFLNPVPSFAESRGEILSPINVYSDKFILLVNPGIHISTKWAFGLVKPQAPNNSLKTLIKNNQMDIDKIIEIASNDFENIVFSKYPEIKDIKDKMTQFGAIFSMMTGTGSTVWGLFDDEEAVHQTELYFKCKNYFTYIEYPT